MWEPTTLDELYKTFDPERLGQCKKCSSTCCVADSDDGLCCGCDIEDVEDEPEPEDVPDDIPF